jgi:DNA-binding transcriptional MocR family regulator
VVEDDYEFEMSFLNPPAPALKSLDEEGRVIYVGSFSKSLFPGLRLGYIVGSETFIREARALRMVVVRHPLRAISSARWQISSRLVILMRLWHAWARPTDGGAM